MRFVVCLVGPVFFHWRAQPWNALTVGFPFTRRAIQRVFWRECIHHTQMNATTLPSSHVHYCLIHAHLDTISPFFLCFLPPRGQVVSHLFIWPFNITLMYFHYPQSLHYALQSPRAKELVKLEWSWEERKTKRGNARAEARQTFLSSQRKDVFY